MTTLTLKKIKVKVFIQKKYEILFKFLNWNFIFFSPKQFFREQSKGITVSIHSKGRPSPRGSTLQTAFRAPLIPVR